MVSAVAAILLIAQTQAAEPPRRARAEKVTCKLAKDPEAELWWRQCLTRAEWQRRARAPSRYPIATGPSRQDSVKGYN